VAWAGIRKGGNLLGGGVKPACEKDPPTSCRFGGAIVKRDYFCKNAGCKKERKIGGNLNKEEGGLAPALVGAIVEKLRQKKTPW